jgi:GT2 family glycosyltransferase
MDLSVIIVTFNSAGYLDACLDALDGHLAGLSTEICVVDNASEDASREIASRRAPRVQLVANPRNLGFAAGVNRGLAATSGRSVLWLNPDSVLLNGGARELVAYLDAHPEAGILGPKILDPDGELQRSARAFPSYDWALGHRHSLFTRLFPANPYSKRYLRTDLDPARVQDADWVSGACLLHRREVSDRLGGLDERFFMYCEDVDFCLRARQAGWTVRYHPALTVTHHVAASTHRRSRTMLVERHRSLWRYYRKHFPRQWFLDTVAWSAIVGRCALVVAQDLVASPFRRRELV